jgi:hypothetical protein
MENKEVIADHTLWCSVDINCGVVLADILNKIGNKGLVSKVSTHINRFNVRSKALNVLDKGSRTYYLHLLLHDANAAINKAPFPTNVKTFLLNFIRVKFREEINKI